MTPRRAFQTVTPLTTLTRILARVVSRWQAFRATKQADYERIYDEVVVERGHPSGSICGWGIRMGIGKRFEGFLRAHYSDEITIVMQIVPDYLAITRQVTEGVKNAN